MMRVVKDWNKFS